MTFYSAFYIWEKLFTDRIGHPGVVYTQLTSPTFIQFRLLPRPEVCRAILVE